MTVIWHGHLKSTSKVSLTAFRYTFLKKFLGAA